MSDVLLKIFGIAVLGALVGVILRKWNTDVALIFKATVGIVAAIACVILLSPLIDSIKDMSESALGESASKAISVLLRVLCVALLSHICASVCRDCGEGTIAYFAELGGKIEILMLCLPLFSDVFDIAAELLEMST